MQADKYIRKPFEVDAVQVTKDNFKEVSEWCMGEIRHKTAEGRGLKEYIKVRVHRPLNARQTEAYVGDWILYANKGYKVYTAKAFEESFTKKESFQIHVHNAPEGARSV